MLKQINQPTNAPLEWISEHIPISMSVASNVPNFTTPKCFINPNLEELLKGALDYMQEIAVELSTLTNRKMDSSVTKFKATKKYWNDLYYKISGQQTQTPKDKSENPPTQASTVEPWEVDS